MDILLYAYFIWLRWLRFIGNQEYFKADVLFDGKSSASFIDIDVFSDFGITVIFQDYEDIPYLQFSNSKFMPYMSIVDLLMNNGTNSLEIILSSPLASEVS